MPKSILLDDNKHEFRFLDQGSSLKLPGAIDQMAVHARSSVTLREKQALLAVASFSGLGPHT